MWPDRRLLDVLGIDVPIIQAPMAGSVGAPMAAAVSAAGGLGSIPCALLDPDAIRAEVEAFRDATDRPLNLNFFCHQPPAVDPAVEEAWRQRLGAYFAELGLDPAAPAPPVNRAPFDGDACDLLEELRPEVVSFHFGLPATELVDRVHRCGAFVLSSATTVDEARWLEDHGCDVVIAQGAEAGGHRGMFLTDDPSTQIGTMALVPQVVDAVAVPVVAAGGIGDSRGVAAALMLGAAGVQLGTAYLFCPEAHPSPAHRAALHSPAAAATALTNVFTGRPARSVVNRLVREVGPISPDAPPFPLAAGAAVLLRMDAERAGSDDFTPLWSGQAARLGRDLPAAELTELLAREALTRLSGPE